MSETNTNVALNGTVVASPIVPTGTADEYATHSAKYGKGGYRSVETIEERNSIKSGRLEDGMLVFVKSTNKFYQYVEDAITVNNELTHWIEPPFSASSKGGYLVVDNYNALNSIEDSQLEEGMLVFVKGDNKFYQYGGLTETTPPQRIWTEPPFNDLRMGVPIYDNNKIAELGLDSSVDHIHIPNKDTDLDGEVTNEQYIVTKNGSYVDILFSALRKLQSEVAKLRNAFNYGIYSYTGKDTAMSRVLGEELENSEEEEPLWSIEEDGLSEIEGASITMDEYGAELLSPIENVDATNEGFFIINSEGASWIDEDLVSRIEDPKLFLYLTSSNKNIRLILKEMENEGESMEVDLSALTTVSLTTYNILVVLSRKQKIESEENGAISYKGHNYIWISIGNPVTDATIAEGYYNRQNTLNSDLVELENRYTIDKVQFTNLTLSKCNFYSKYQDFSKEVIPSKPTDNNYTYKAAHITIRSVDTYTTLDRIKNQLPENELIFVEDTRRLYIKNNYTLIAIGSGGGSTDDDTGMTKEEILELLENMGIVAKNGDNGDLSLSALSDITFIHEDTNKKFKFEVDAYGSLRSTELGKETLSERLENSNITLEDYKFRGIIGQLGLKEQNNLVEGTSATKLTETDDLGLYSDRVKIGAFYAPARNNETFGCSHGFIELENTCNRDFPLDGCYLHYARIPEGETSPRVSHLALTGYIPGGGTYLIRCKQFADFNDPNVFIKVETFDQEWYEGGKLVDLSHSGISGDKNGLCLTYGEENLSYDTKLWKSNDDTNTKSKAAYLYKYCYIDGVYFNSIFTSANDEAYWTTAKNAMSVIIDDKFIDSIYRNTFELDPAKQAYQALTTYDSSRYRNANKNDFQYIRLDKEYISFPKTDEQYSIKKFTPKASFEKKNVLTDKNVLNPNKPNMVTCSFGINPYTTRTFNWISAGLFDEFVWIKSGNTWKKFQSYTKITGSTPNTEDNSSYPYRKEFSVDINNIIYARIHGSFPGNEESSYTSHKCILVIRENAPTEPEEYTYVVGPQNKNEGPDLEKCSEEMACAVKLNEVIKNGIKEYRQYTQQEVNEFNSQLEGAISTNIINPESGVNYTESEAIAFNSKLDGAISTNMINPESGVNYTVEEVAEYNANHSDQISTDMINPDTQVNYTESEAIEFNSKLDGAVSTNMINPATQVNYTESEVNEFNSKLDGAISTNNYNTFYKGIIPVLINTGDMTQSGARINEWIDYYNAGKNLFNHLEQVNVVGNNDLCGTDFTVLGTGDDIGKSNSYYFHVFYCYEVSTNTNEIPIINGKYVPSLYYIDFNKIRLILVNSEITKENCQNWFNVNSGGNVVNVYTGWTMPDTGTPTFYSSDSFTSIYTMLYHYTNTNKEIVVACHEMPFTVITNANLKYDTNASQIKGDSCSRSLNKTSLVGSHLNQMHYTDKVGIYWFSRLLEYRKVHLCIGGHKHTYACTYPLMENYRYNNGNSSSKNNGPMTMNETLANDDSVSWLGEVTIGSSTIVDANLSKFPLSTRSGNFNIASEQFYPIQQVSSFANGYDGVIYLMCQATGFKLMSNKELPSPNQAFSRLIPKTEKDNEGNDKASSDQRYPMYTIIDLGKKEVVQINNDSVEKEYLVAKLIRLKNIQKNPTTLFTQFNYGVNPTTEEYLRESVDGDSWEYGTWDGNSSNNILKIEIK